MEDSLHERGRAMEDLYFQQKDHILMEKLRAELSKEENRKSLQQVTGLADPALLDQILAANVSPESFVALSLIPLVAVAWVDDRLETGEKDAILQAADLAGIKSGSAAYETLSGWLSTKPAPEMLQVWEAYVKAMKSKLEVVHFNQFKHQVLGRAEDVAKAAGGFLGLGNKVSHVERSMLDRLAKAFE
jgi:hypothetical protein